MTNTHEIVQNYGDDLNSDPFEVKTEPDEETLRRLDKVEKLIEVLEQKVSAMKMVGFVDPFLTRNET